MPLPGYSPDLMPVEALWRWLREDVTYHHCHSSPGDLTRRVAAFETRINTDPCALADRLWVEGVSKLVQAPPRRTIRTSSRSCTGDFPVYQGLQEIKLLHGKALPRFDTLSVKDQLDPKEEELRFPK